MAAKALRDEPLSRRGILSLSSIHRTTNCSPCCTPPFRFAPTYFGRTVRLQMLQNAKSGACMEDCHYCSQSAVSTAPIERYNLLPKMQMIEGARQAAASKAQRYCIVISGRSPLDREIDEIAGAVRAHQTGNSHSDLLLPRPDEWSAGSAPESGRRGSCEPQLEYQRGLSCLNLHDPHFPGSSHDNQECEGRGIGNLFRRDCRHGRDRSLDVIALAWLCGM